MAGVDLNEPMLRAGLARARRPGQRGRVLVAVGTADRLPFPDATFDALSFSYLLRYVDDPAATVAEMARVVRPGGTVASLEFMVPPQPGWRAAWWLYTRLGLPLGGLLTGRPGTGSAASSGRASPSTTGGTPWTTTSRPGTRPG